ncbi:MAG: response regulator transcription factor [Terriglobia bacterium]
MSKLVEGRTGRRIADDLGISGETVKRHLANIFDKLGVSSRLEVALFAVHHQLIDRPYTGRPEEMPRPSVRRC